MCCLNIVIVRTSKNHRWCPVKWPDVSRLDPESVSNEPDLIETSFMYNKS